MSRNCCKFWNNDAILLLFWRKYYKAKYVYKMDHPKLDTRISVLRRLSVRLRVPPLDSKTGWTGELWSNPVLLIFENYKDSIFSSSFLATLKKNNNKNDFLIFFVMFSDFWISWLFLTLFGIFFYGFLDFSCIIIFLNLLDMRHKTWGFRSFVRHAQGSGFWVDWRALVESCPHNIGKLRG